MNIDIKDILLIVIALLNFILGIILIRKNSQSPINLSFATLVFAVGLWSFGLAMFNTTLNMEVAAAWARMYYFASAIIIFSFAVFSVYYIYPLFILNKVKFIYLLLPLFIITFIIFHPTLLIENASHYDWGNDANEKLIGHVAYAFYFFGYLALAYSILFKKLKKSEGVNYLNLRSFLWVISIGFLFGVLFDLILPLLGIYKYVWVEPYFSLIYIVYLIWLIFYKK